jgi:hypothetical protein
MNTNNLADVGNSADVANNGENVYISNFQKVNNQDNGVYQQSLPGETYLILNCSFFLICLFKKN